GRDRRHLARPRDQTATEPSGSNRTRVEERSTMKVTVDEDKCCGAGTCVMSAPDVFDQRDEDGIVLLLYSDPGAELHGAVREAAAVCPARAIEISGGA